MRKISSIRELVPRWNMPSDPIKAVWWFMGWLLKVLVNFFWIPIIGMVIYETISNWQFDGAMNGIVSGVVTLIVGLIVWGILAFVRSIVNVTERVSQVVSDVGRFQQSYGYRRSSDPLDPSEQMGQKPKVVEGTIIDIETKRRERK